MNVLVNDEMSLLKDFEDMLVRKDMLNELQRIRLRLDDMTQLTKSLCINCLEAKYRERDHRIKYKAEMLAKRDFK